MCSWGVTIGWLSTLQTGIFHSDRHRVLIKDSHVRAQLDDFKAVAADLHLHPSTTTRLLAENVPDLPSGILGGAIDAAKPGIMGGVWFINGAPLLS